MKKIVAILLAVLLLGSATAFAETATLYTVSDPVLAVDVDGEQINLDLNGLTIACAVLEEGDAPKFALNVLGNGECLFAAAARLEGNVLLLSAEGLSNTYKVEIPDVASSVQNVQDIDLSGLDTDALMQTITEGVEIDQDGDTMIVTVPYNVLNDVLTQVAPVLQSVEIEGVDMSEFESAVSELVESNSGVTIVAAVKMEDAGMALNADLYPVQDGEQAEQSVLNVSVNTDAQQYDFAVSVPDAGVYFNLNVAPETGKITLQVNSDDFDATLSFVVGSEEGEIVVADIGDAASAIELTEMVEEDMNTLTNELMQAASGLIGFLYPILAQVGAV